METLFLRELVVFLAAAGVVIPLGQRLRVSPVLGFLLIGLALGPWGLARLTGEWPWLRWLVLTDIDEVRALAELGVVFLLFMIGLQLSLERLWAMRRLVFGLGSAQIAISGVIIGAFAWGFGNSLEAAVVLGACMALSSTAVVIQLLTEQGRFGSRVGRGSFAVLLAQDLAVVPVLFVVSALGAQGDASLAVELAAALGRAVLAVVAILVVGRLLLRPLFRLVGDTHSPELFMAATLLIIIATAALTHAAGLSAALGSFLAGLLFAETEFRHEIEVDIEPFKGLLLGLFFMSVGMVIDLAEIATEPLWIALSVIGLFAIKTAVLGVCARLFGYSPGQAVEMGLLLGQGGEFGFVVIGLALGYGLLPDATAQFMLIVVAATMFLTPLVARLARAAGRAIDRHDGDDDEANIDIAPDLRGHVVIAGFGRTGQLLARVLDRQHIEHVAVDSNVRRVAARHAEGAPVYVGDASRAVILERLRVGEAAALVVTMDNAAAAERVVRAARALAPQIPIIVRARDDSHATRLLDHGATHVVPEVLEAGLEMGRMMIEQVGFPADAARELVEIVRAESEPPGGRER